MTREYREYEHEIGLKRPGSTRSISTKMTRVNRQQKTPCHWNEQQVLWRVLHCSKFWGVRTPGFHQKLRKPVKNRLTLASNCWFAEFQPSTLAPKSKKKLWHPPRTSWENHGKSMLLSDVFSLYSWPLNSRHFSHLLTLPASKRLRATKPTKNSSSCRIFATCAFIEGFPFPVLKNGARFRTWILSPWRF